MMTSMQFKGQGHGHISPSPSPCPSPSTALQVTGIPRPTSAVSVPVSVPVVSVESPPPPLQPCENPLDILAGMTISKMKTSSSASPYFTNNFNLSQSQSQSQILSQSSAHLPLSKFTVKSVDLRNAPDIHVKAGLRPASPSMTWKNYGQPRPHEVYQLEQQHQQQQQSTNRQEAALLVETLGNMNLKLEDLPLEEAERSNFHIINSASPIFLDRLAKSTTLIQQIQHKQQLKAQIMASKIPDSGALSPKNMSQQIYTQNEQGQPILAITGSNKIDQPDSHYFINSKEMANASKLQLLKTMSQLRHYKTGTSPEKKVHLLQHQISAPELSNNQLRKSTSANGEHNFSPTLVRPQSTSSIRKAPNSREDAMENMRQYHPDSEYPKKSVSNLKFPVDFKELVVKNASDFNTIPHFIPSNQNSYDGSSALSMASSYKQAGSTGTPLYTPATFRQPVQRDKTEVAEELVVLTNKLEDVSVPDSLAMSEDRKETYIQNGMKSANDDSSGAKIDLQIGSLPLEKDSQENDIIVQDKYVRTTIPAKVNKKYYRDGEDLHRTQSPRRSRPQSPVRYAEEDGSAAPSPLMQKPGPGHPNNLHCSSCVNKEAILWCTRCIKAFCGICWNRVNHHTFYKMVADPNTIKEEEAFKKLTKQKIDMQRSTSSLRPFNEMGIAAERSHSSPGKSYSQNILFTSYVGDNEAGAKSEVQPSTLDGNLSPAKIPQINNPIVQFMDYPNPPVFIDGKGNICTHTDKIRFSGTRDAPKEFGGKLRSHQSLRAFSSPEGGRSRNSSPNQSRPASSGGQFSPPQSPNHVSGLSSPDEASVDQEPSVPELEMNDSLYTADFNAQVTSAVHYVTKEKLIEQTAGRPLPLKMSVAAGKRIVLREPLPYRGEMRKRKKAKPAFTLGSNGGGLTICKYGAPAKNVEQLTGIAYDLNSTIDWKTGTFQSGAYYGTEHPKRPHTTHGGAPSEVRQREIKIYQGVPIYVLKKPK